MLRSAATKERLVLAGAESSVATAQLLEAMDALLPKIDQAALRNPAKFTRSLAEQEAAVDAQARRALSVHADVESLLDTYNQLIHSLSARLVYMNTQLTAWERRLDDIEKRR